MGNIANILKASSDDLRIKIIELLDREGPKSYSGLMKSLNLNPIQDAGRFAYHLKMLTRSGLVNVDKRLKKYKVTDLGKLCANFVNELKGHTLKRKPLVRTSRLRMEEFNRGKIIADLIREANVPMVIAKRIARDIEAQVMTRAPSNLTGPLIRDMISSYLIKDPSLEEFRGNFARLGLPLYDVAELLDRSSSTTTLDGIIRAAGNAVLREYALIKVYERGVIESHISGLIHIDQIETWFKPEIVWHDLRVFLHGGLPTPSQFSSPAPKPKSFDGALVLVSNLAALSSSEVSKEEVIDHFNVFLAPYAHRLDTKDIKRALSVFIYNLSRSVEEPVHVSLGLDFFVPRSIGEIEITRPGARSRGVYDDYENEAREILRCLLELMFNDPLNRPVFTPSIILHLSSKAFNDDLFVKAHKLALDCGTPNFAVRYGEISPSSNGLMSVANWTGDWEVDTMRMGNIGTVSVNLPRLALEAHGNWTVFLEKMEEAIKTGVKTLKAKSDRIKEFIQRRSLPVLSSLVLKGETYFRTRESLQPFQIVGLDEAVAIHTGHHLHESGDSLTLATKLVKQIVEMVNRESRKPDFRATVVKLKGLKVAERFANINVEDFGRAEAQVHGTRRHPYYTSCENVPYHVDIPWQERLRIESKISKLIPSGHILHLPLPDRERFVKHLLTTTQEVCENEIHFFTYTRNLSYCGICQRIIRRKKTRCPFCGSAGLVYYPPRHLSVS